MFDPVSFALDFQMLEAGTIEFSNVTSCLPPGMYIDSGGAMGIYSS